MSLKLSYQAGLLQLLKQPNEIVGVQLEGSPCGRIQHIASLIVIIRTIKGEEVIE